MNNVITSSVVFFVKGYPWSNFIPYVEVEGVYINQIVVQSQELNHCKMLSISHFLERNRLASMYPLQNFFKTELTKLQTTIFPNYVIIIFAKMSLDENPIETLINFLTVRFQSSIVNLVVYFSSYAFFIVILIVIVYSQSNQPRNNSNKKEDNNKNYLVKVFLFKKDD